MGRPIKWIETYIDVKTFNEKLALIKACREIKVADAHALWKNGLWYGFKTNAYVWDTGRGTMHLCYRMGTKNFNFATKLDGTDEDKAKEQIVSGGTSYRIMQRYNKLPKVHPEWHKLLPSCRAILYYNKNYSGTTIDHAWSYDMNSAYCHILMHYDFPDLEHPLDIGVVESGQIGFNADFTKLIHKGNLAVNRYPLMESPYKKFAETRFEKIKALRSAGRKAESKKYKSMLTNGVGYLVYARPIDRNYIILCTNEIIEKCIDKYGDVILFANTDSLTSSIPLQDLDIGDNCGQFKIEHEDAPFQYNGVNYCWLGEIPKVRGKSKGFWKYGDTLSNVTDARAFKYMMDWEVCQIVKTETETEK